MAVENRMHDAILTAMVKVAIPRVEMAMRSITNSSGHEPNSVVQNPDRRDFTAKTENTPLTSTSSRLGLNIDQDQFDESHDFENLEDGDFAALKLNHDWRAQSHHMVTGHYATQNSMPEFLQDVQLGTTHCLRNILNRKIWQHTSHPTARCQWLSNHSRDKTQTHANLSTELPTQLHILHFNNDAKRRQR